MMKVKKISLFVVVMSCLVFTAACGSSKEERENAEIAAIEEGWDQEMADMLNGEDEEQEESQEESADQGAPDISVEEQVILDQEGIVVTLKSMEFNGAFDPSINVFIENNTDEAVIVQMYNAVFNDVMVRSMMHCEVEAGKKTDYDMSFDSFELEKANISSIKDIEFNLYVSDTESREDLFHSDVIKITTTADPSSVQTYDDSGTVMFEDKGIKIVFKDVETGENINGANIHMYVENDFGNDISIYSEETSINGFMIDPWFATNVTAGKKIYDWIPIYQEDLDDSGIDSIDEMEMSFKIVDASNGETIVTTPNASATFQ